MLSRRDFLAAAALGGLAAGPASAQSIRQLRVGILGATTATAYATRWDAFRQGLRDFGYVEGRNLVIDARWADGRGERLPALAQELVALRPDILVTHGIPGTRAAQAATTTIPIVMAIVTDPVSAGLVQSFARPGGNVTGSAWFAPELAAKRVGLLKEVDPRLSHVAVLSNPGNPAFASAMLEAMDASARPAGVRLQRFDARGPVDFPVAMAAMTKARVDGVAVLEEAVLNSHPAEIAALARQHRLPAIGNREFAEAGGLVGYGVDLHAMFRRAASLVDRLAKGARAAELPIEQATTFELVLNAATARALDLTLPTAMTLRAVRVIG